MAMKGTPHAPEIYFLIIRTTKSIYINLSGEVKLVSLILIWYFMLLAFC